MRGPEAARGTFHPKGKCPAVCKCLTRRFHSPLGGHRLGYVGPDPRLVHGVQQVLAVHSQSVRRRQQLFLTLVLQRGDGVLLGQTHLTDQLGHVVVQQLLGALDPRQQSKQWILQWTYTITSRRFYNTEE